MRGRPLTVWGLRRSRVWRGSAPETRACVRRVRCGCRYRSSRGLRAAFPDIRSRDPARATASRNCRACATGARTSTPPWAMNSGTVRRAAFCTGEIASSAAWSSPTTWRRYARPERTLLHVAALEQQRQVVDTGNADRTFIQVGFEQRVHDGRVRTEALAENRDPLRIGNALCNRPARRVGNVVLNDAAPLAESGAMKRRPYPGEPR